MTGAIMVAGICSDAGKSIVVAGICRWLARAGVKVAPFKAQTMALNSAVTPGGAEIGRAQAAQAAAARVTPEAAMNPILLKPSGERCQVVLLGRSLTEVDARSYPSLKSLLLPIVLDAFEDLRSRFEVVVCEGAGSPAEINLRGSDLANMGLARAASLPVLIVGDIDRGGVFASLYGTLALLDPADQALVSGFLINKFRGDRDVLEPGIQAIGSLTGRPVLGVLPWVHGLWLDVEDSLALDDRGDGASPPLGRDRIDVAVVRLRWMSNFTDLDALAAEPGVTVRFTQHPADLARADLVVLPGTKATVEDLAWLRSERLDVALAERAERGAPVLGVCGGYQLLGTRIVDRVESDAGEVSGLGLLPVETVFERDKVLATPAGVSPVFDAAAATGYEIHHGRMRRTGGEPVFVTSNGEDGCRVGAVVGTSWHGALEGDEFRRAFLRWVADARGLDWLPGARPFATVREERLDRLGDLVEGSIELGALTTMIEHGPTKGLPCADPAERFVDHYR